MAKKKDKQALKKQVCELIDGYASASMSLAELAREVYLLDGSIPFPWHVDDVRTAWETMNYPDERDCPLDNEQCMEILGMVELHHDASVGVNWTVIEACARAQTTSLT